MKKIMFFVISCLVLMTSCKKDFLDTGPTDQMDDSAAFTTTANASNIINGIYRYLWERYSTQNQPGHGGVMLQLDFMGEDIHLGAASWYTNSANGTGNWINHKNDTYIWTEFPFRLYYRVVGNANALIENIDAASGPEGDKIQLKAEAKTMRAWAYFNLVQLFAKRYQAGAVNSQPGLSMPLSAKQVRLPRASVEEVYAQINKDLDEAIQLAKKGQGSLCCSMVTADDRLATEFVVGAATHHGRMLVLNRENAKESTGHGSPLPLLVHGGPGRAGGGEEMGGVRGVRHYMQRVAIQGSPTVITAITKQYQQGAKGMQSDVHPFRKY
ncbi:MAG: hypothetical protein EOP49_15485, partial [Sphingobacteriales bacterium]